MIILFVTDALQEKMWIRNYHTYTPKTNKIIQRLREYWECLTCKALYIETWKGTRRWLTKRSWYLIWWNFTLWRELRLKIKDFWDFHQFHNCVVVWLLRNWSPDQLHPYVSVKNLSLHSLMLSAHFFFCVPLLIKLVTYSRVVARLRYGHTISNSEPSNGSRSR